MKNQTPLSKEVIGSEQLHSTRDFHIINIRGTITGKKNHSQIIYNIQSNMLILIYKKNFNTKTSFCLQVENFLLNRAVFIRRLTVADHSTVYWKGRGEEAETFWRPETKRCRTAPEWVCIGYTSQDTQVQKRKEKQKHETKLNR